MSTPTITRAAYDAQATSPLDNGSLPPHYAASTGMRLDLLLGVAAELKAAGYPIGDSIDRAQTILDAVREATMPADGPGTFLANTNVLELSPDDAAAAARRIAAEALATRDTQARSTADDTIAKALYPAVLAAFRQDTADALTAMATEFDTALEKVSKAHRAKLTTATRGDDILMTGTTAQVAAYRDLGPAVAILNQLAALRIRLCNIAGLGPASHPIACLVKNTDLDSAAAIYTGQDMTVLVENDHASAAPFASKIPTPRLGGAWLALIEAGHTPHLNTADEADNVYRDRTKEN